MLQDTLGLFQFGSHATVAGLIQNGAPEGQQIRFIPDTKNLWALLCH
jgi:hypothetical protein